MAINPTTHKRSRAAASVLLPALLATPALASEWAAYFSGETDDAQPVFLRPIGPEPHPFSLDQGRFQIEVSPFSYAYNRRDGEGARIRSHAFDIPALIKYGVTDTIDIQVGADLFVWERSRERGESDWDTDSGFGDLTFRVKKNLWGNDGERPTAVAVMPYLIFPTATGGMGETGIRGGLMVPFAWEFQEGWALDVVPSVAAVRNLDDDGYETEFAGLFTLNREIRDGLDAFVDFHAAVTTESGRRWLGLVGVGLTFEIDDNLVLEPAVHFGVTREAEDFAASLTIVRRF